MIGQSKSVMGHSSGQTSPKPIIVQSNHRSLPQSALSGCPQKKASSGQSLAGHETNESSAHVHPFACIHSSPSPTLGTRQSASVILLSAAACSPGSSRRIRCRGASGAHSTSRQHPSLGIRRRSCSMMQSSSRAGLQRWVPVSALR